ncbi:uncharacterized protein BO97DRAFT_417139 [Aspergillus homomorphus CBS 101889]|uniref:F-box domain-containing protein n=1 Tax=Aspergillus homomorphus (strain CBS 101889) TaxID=1450537 RepID=A0A395HQD3_ASPHC|nr:hypothetical protein BO97DRAFT_417139 [Aspergillus homomorphus CBS 101889]RAL09068.1 hypothetical protein BO97DRAFT_417139 [Aspergillus homomorphus CBS 101889]
MSRIRQRILEFFAQYRGRIFTGRPQRMSNTPATGLAALPTEVAVECIFYMDTATLCVLRLTCKSFRDLVRETLQARCRESVLPPQSTYDRVMAISEDGTRRSSRYSWRKGRVKQPLARLVAHGRCDAVRFCLDAGLSANVYDLSARPLLHIASLHTQIAMAHLLLEHGADPHATVSPARYTALDYVRWIPLYDEFEPPVPLDEDLPAQEDMVRLLLGAGARYTTENGEGILPFLCGMRDYQALLRRAMLNGTYPEPEDIARHLLRFIYWPEGVRKIVEALPEVKSAVTIDRSRRRESRRSAIQQAMIEQHMPLALEMIKCDMPLNLGDYRTQYPELFIAVDNIYHWRFQTNTYDWQIVHALLRRDEIRRAGFLPWVNQGPNRHEVFQFPLNHYLLQQDWPMVAMLLRMNL